MPDKAKSTKKQIEKISSSKENTYVPLTKAEKRKKIFFLVSALIAINLFVFGSFYFTFYKVNETKKIDLNSEKSKEVSSNSFPFQNMTIPALRARDYKSILNNKQIIDQNDSYTSYLTSYTSDGLKINGLLTIPTGEKPKNGWPAIVFVHGYIPPSTYTSTGNYVDYVDYLARNGYVVFKIDLRGHGKSEGVAGGGYFGSDYIVDALNARAALQSSDFVNRNKIGLWGHSMAGNIVTRALAARPEIPATVIWAGAVYTYVDMQKYGIQDSSYRPPADVSKNTNRRNEIYKKYGQFNSNSVFWKLVPFTNYLNDIKGAISLNHAKDDNVVNIGYSRDLNAILNKTKIPHELNEYPSGGHNINGDSFTPAMQNTVKFFNKYLKD